VILLIAKPKLQWQILKQNISEQSAFSVLFLQLKFCKNLGFYPRGYIFNLYFLLLGRLREQIIQFI
jgi:hypothetical protein